MRLRPFGQRSGFEVPRANIGAMRLPGDEDEAIALIRHAIDSGMRYIDTSRGYGDSEIKIGKALKDGYREKVILSTKWSAWIKKFDDADEPTADCVRMRLEESMQRLDVDYLDFYQVWNINNRENYNIAIGPGGPLEGILKAKDEGLIGHTGFTAHDSVENLLDYVKEADWCEVLLLSYNLLNTAVEPVLEAAASQGIGTIIMNPVAGGRLSEQSAFLGELAHRVGCRSVADLAIRWIMSNPNVDTIISGISKTTDVDDTIASVDDGPFDADQMAAINEALDTVASQRDKFCTGCRYCMPCPQDVDIPGVMSAIFDDRVWGLKKAAKQRYSRIRAAKADACIHCGVCEGKCPQNLGITDEMEYANMAYGDFR